MGTSSCRSSNTPVCKAVSNHANTFPPPILKKSNCVNKVFYTRVSPKKVTYKVGFIINLDSSKAKTKNELTLTKSIPSEYSSEEQSPKSPKEDVYCIYYV